MENFPHKRESLQVVEEIYGQWVYLVDLIRIQKKKDGHLAQYHCSVYI
jgi:hypothetical protein